MPRSQHLDRGRSIRLDQGGITAAARARQSGPGGPATALGALANAALKPRPCRNSRFCGKSHRLRRAQCVIVPKVTSDDQIVCHWIPPAGSVAETM